MNKTIISSNELRKYRKDIKEVIYGSLIVK